MTAPRGPVQAQHAIARLWETRIPADFLGDRDALVAFREGFGSNMAISQSNDVLRLEIDRWWQEDAPGVGRPAVSSAAITPTQGPQSLLFVRDCPSFFDD